MTAPRLKKHTAVKRPPKAKPRAEPFSRIAALFLRQSDLFWCHTKTIAPSTVSSSLHLPPGPFDVPLPPLAPLRHSLLRAIIVVVVDPLSFPSLSFHCSRFSNVVHNVIIHFKGAEKPPSYYLLYILSYTHNHNA